MSELSDKTLEILISSERIADEILMNKQEIIALDKRRQQTREALREITKQDNESTTWVTIGSLLVKMKKDKALNLMRKDQIQIEADIDKLRHNQHILVAKHRDLEHMAPAKGMNLKPLSKNEIVGIKSNMPNLY